MGLEELREEIISKGAKEASLIIESAQKEASEIISQAQATLTEIKKKTLREAKAAADTLEIKEIAKANFEMKKQILNKKQELIDSVFAKASSKISSIPDSKNQEMFKKLLEKAAQQIEISTLYINRKDKDLARNYSWVATDIMGGIIAENKDKTIRVDLSYDTILASTKNKVLSEIVKVLYE